MVNYQNGKIYKIVSNETDMIYIGSTCKLLCQRLAQHRSTYKAYQSGKYRFVTSFKLLEIGECKIILLEKFPCNSREELNARERFYIENNECVNKVVPMRTRIEYNKDNRENILLQKNQKHMCNCGGKYTSTHKSHHVKTKSHMEYIESLNQTVEIKIEQQIIEKQDDVMIDRPQMNDLYMCSCGALCSLNSRFWHLKTRRHLEP
jgi:hypothetical protein